MMIMVKKALKGNVSTSTRLLSIIPQRFLAAATPVKTSQCYRPQRVLPREKYKSVCLTALPIHSHTRDWMVVNPNYHAEGDDDCKFTLRQMHPDTPLVTWQFGCASYDSNSYFAGGEYDDHLYSNQVFTYHHNTETLELALPCLNIARCKPEVAVVGNVIYVCGGQDNWDLTPDTWMEYFDPSNNNDQTWKFLASPVPQDLISLSRSIGSSAVYELGSQILFFVPILRQCYEPALAIYSFNYASKTWDRIEMDLHMTYDSNAAIVEHILFLPTSTTICAYDLSKRLLLFEHSLEAHACTCEACSRPNGGFCEETLHLFHVGKDTLLLLCPHDRSNNTGVGPRLACYKYRIEYSSEDHSRPTCLRLDGSHCFPLKHYFYDIESLVL